jgi:Transcriptional regulator, AbiEi antitoxin
MRTEIPSSSRSLIRRQGGVITRRQAVTTGLPATTVESWVQRGRWTRLARGIYAASGGPPSRDALLWAALLRAGPDAVLSHETAAELCGLLPRPGPVIHVTVPARRNPARSGAMPGIVVHRSDRAGRGRSRAGRAGAGRRPPHTRIDETVIDLTQTSASFGEAFSWLGRAVARGLTTPRRLSRDAASRPRLHWRAGIGAALAELARGGLLAGDPPGSPGRRRGGPTARGGGTSDGCRPVQFM